MIAVDSNILVYAHRQESPWNETAHACMEHLWGGTDRWFIPWPCLHEFFCVVTHPKLYDPPTKISDALAQIDGWLSSQTVLVGSEGDNYIETFRLLVNNGHVVGPLVYDARIAALCLQAGVSTLWTADRDFSRFPDLHCENPLVRRK